MKNRIAFISAGLVAVAALAFWLWPQEPAVTVATPDSPAVASPFSATPSTAAAAQEQPSIFVPADEAIQPPTEAEDEYLGERFNLDAAGNLIVDGRARVTLEKLYALYTPEQQAQRLQELGQTLPPAALTRVSALLEQYKEYSTALKQNFPPDSAPANEDDALVQLDGINALRVAHFGEDAATGLFGEEEKLNRQLLTLMTLEKDESLTMEEKAERAQQLISKNPDLAAIEKRNQESATN